MPASTAGMIKGTGPRAEIEANDCPPLSTTSPVEDPETDEPSGRNQNNKPTTTHQRRLAAAKATMSFQVRFMTNPPS